MVESGSVVSMSSMSGREAAGAPRSRVPERVRVDFAESEMLDKQVL